MVGLGLGSLSSSVSFRLRRGREVAYYLLGVVRHYRSRLGTCPLSPPRPSLEIAGTFMSADSQLVRYSKLEMREGYRVRVAHSPLPIHLRLRLRWWLLNIYVFSTIYQKISNDCGLKTQITSNLYLIATKALIHFRSRAEIVSPCCLATSVSCLCVSSGILIWITLLWYILSLSCIIYLACVSLSSFKCANLWHIPAEREVTYLSFLNNSPFCANACALIALTYSCWPTEYPIW